MVIKNSWIFSKKIDLFIFLGPLVTGWLFVIGINTLEVQTVPTPAWAGFLFLTASDTVHIFSTLFRTYLDPEELQSRRKLYIRTPLICYGIGFFLYYKSSALFWTFLTYLNVFHIIRQQYGWMAYSARKAGEKRTSWEWSLDKIAIYLATLYPLIWWHTHLPKPFQLNGDFIHGLPLSVSNILSFIYWEYSFFYLLMQVYRIHFNKPWNATKTLIWLSTTLTWYCAMILAQSELIFLALGSLVHSTPYLTLIYIYGQKRWSKTNVWPSRFFHRHGWVFFYSILLVLAIFHECISDFSKSLSHPVLLCLTIPLVTLPQSLHYVLDAFIWKTGNSNPMLAQRLGFK